MMTRTTSAYVVGAGAAGAFAALALLREGVDVTLVDAWEPGHAAAASGGEHRILRSSHGTDEWYAKWAYEARFGWMRLAEESGQELFVQCGSVALAKRGNTAWEDASAEVLARNGIPHFIAPAEELGARLPIADSADIEYGLWEPEAGLIYAGRATSAAVDQVQREGGKLIRGNVCTDSQERPLLDGAPLQSDLIVMACGAWMGDLFPRTVRRHVKVARQNIIMISPPPGDSRYDATSFPCWIDHGNGAFGIPAAGGFGFKAALIWHQLDIDLEHEDRLVDATTIARTRRYLEMRFPELTGRPITQIAVGQIANTADTHFIIDRHPVHTDVIISAGDSGHLFKHGPVVGEYIASLGLGKITTDDRFRLRDRASATGAGRPQ
ncbi:FAD-dependent oxidoreductase [Brevibacterium linens]|uniref:FAD-dependent oxidoreductase n=1 Tax=Brevibacterium linens TaxID=1703 RepID=UPI003BF585C6